VRAAGLEHFDQRGQMRKTTHLAVGFGRFFKVQVREGMGLCRTGADVEILQQTLAHHMRGAAIGFRHTQVDVGLAEVNGHQLRMAIGEMQKTDVAKFGQVIQLVGRAGLGCQHIFVVQGHAPCTGHSQHLHEFAAGKAHEYSLLIKFACSSQKRGGSHPSQNQHHWLTGDLGSSNNAITSLICCSVSTPLAPARGIREQALYACGFQILPQV
jgi:hypothetical protein